VRYGSRTGSETVVRMAVSFTSLDALCDKADHASYVSTFDAVLAALCVLGTALAGFAWLSRAPDGNGDKGNDRGLVPKEGGQAASEPTEPSINNNANKDAGAPNVTTGRDISGEELARDGKRMQLALESAKRKFRKDSGSSS
jgi:hypothetical protein